jgi:hypothetical protein
MMMSNDAAFLELLSSYEAAIAAASFALDTAKALAKAHRNGGHLSTPALEQTMFRIERHAADLEKLRANVAQFKAMFRTIKNKVRSGKPLPLREPMGRGRASRS